jgi:hypothetical protein
MGSERPEMCDWSRSQRHRMRSPNHATCWSSAGPTHVHGMSRESTRQAAVADGAKDDALIVEPHADGPGARELLESTDVLHGRGAAFDTRVKGPARLTGRAARSIARALKRRGASLVADPESFLVTKDNRLVAGEAERARQWGEALGRIANELDAADVTSIHERDAR